MQWYYQDGKNDTSHNKTISIEFAQNNGMLMQFDKNVVLKKQFRFCSLEWISKFGYECEILIARTKRDDFENVATMKVMDYEMDSLNKTKNNNNSLQIVNVSLFDSQTDGIVLLTHSDIHNLQDICLMGKQGKENALKTYLDLVKKKDASTLEFENGLQLFYNDSTFKEYCNKVKQQKYQLNQTDIVQMQKQSKVMKHLMGNEDFCSHYYGMIMPQECRYDFFLSCANACVCTL